MTSFRRTKVKKVYRIRESLFSKGLQGYTRVSLAIKKIPDDEDVELKNIVKSRVCEDEKVDLLQIYYDFSEEICIN